jgi:hypothetical protein
MPSKLPLRKFRWADYHSWEHVNEVLPVSTVKLVTEDFNGIFTEKRSLDQF